MAEQDQLGLGFEIAKGRQVWAVRDLIAAVRTALEREYADVWVEGEISNYRPADSGHLYFTLKDGESQLRMVMFKSSARLLRFRLASNSPSAWSFALSCSNATWRAPAPLGSR